VAGAVVLVIVNNMSKPYRFHSAAQREISGDGRGFMRPVACSAGLGACTEEYTISLQMCCAASGTGSPLTSR